MPKTRYEYGIKQIWFANDWRTVLTPFPKIQEFTSLPFLYIKIATNMKIKMSYLKI